MNVPKIAVLAAMFAFFGFSLYSVESFTALFMHVGYRIGFA